MIHPNTVIGNNCNISQFLSIGSNNGTPAVIGDNVYIGPHVSIVENVKIGDIICTSLGGESHGIQRRRQKNKGAHG